MSPLLQWSGTHLNALGGTPVAEDYADRMPFRFTGTLRRLVIDLGPMQGEPTASQLKKAADLAD